MSGSVSTAGIQAALPPQQPYQSPLAMLGQIQTIRNQQAALLNTQANTAQTNQTLNVNRMNRQAQVAMGLYDLPDDQLQGGQPIRDALGAELRAGTIDQNTYQQYMGSLPAATDANGNPTSADAFRQNIRSHIISTMAAPDAVKFAVGQPATVDYGGGIQPAFQGGALSANPGSLTPVGAPYGKGLTPEGAATRVPGPPDPKTGVQTTLPVGAIPLPNPGAPGYVGAPPGRSYTGANPPPITNVPSAVTSAPLPPLPPQQPGAVRQPLGAPNAANGGQPAPAMGGTTPATGANTPAVTSTPDTTPPPAPVQPPAQPTSGALPGQISTSLPPSFEDSRKMGQQLTSRAENVAQNKGNYQTLLTDLQGINTGPAASVQQHIAAFFQKWAGNPIIAGLTSDDLAKGEGFGKVATQISLAQGEQLGGTDQIQRASASATPNLSLSTPGNTQIIHKLLGNEDAINEKRNAWNAWSAQNGQGTYNDFSQWWNKNIDMRSFQLPYMPDGSDEKRSTMTFGQTPQGIAAAKQFVAKYKLVQAAQQNGWQTVIPGGQPPPQPGQ